MNSITVHSSLNANNYGKCNLFCATMAFTAGGRFNFITAKGATSVQEDHFHSVYFAAGTAICLLTRKIRSLWGLRTRAVPSGEQDVLVSKLAIDVTDFSRPGVAALRYSHSS